MNVNVNVNVNVSANSCHWLRAEQHLKQVVCRDLVRGIVSRPFVKNLDSEKAICAQMAR